MSAGPITNFLVFLFLAIFTFFYNTSPVQAIGVTPGTTSIANATNGVPITKTIRVTRPETNGSLNFRVDAYGPGSRYITLPTKTLTIPPGRNYAEYQFIIAPTNTPNGTFQAFIQFVSQEPAGTPNMKSSAFSVATYEGATAEVFFTVTDHEVKEYTIINVGAEPVESNSAPSFTYLLKNNGNVDASPESIYFSVSDQEGNLKLTESLNKELPVVPPGQEKNSTVFLTQKLPPAIYFADVTFFNSSTAVYEKKKLRFEIFPEGSLRQNGEIVDFNPEDTRLPAGSLMKLQATFKNTGDIGARARLYVRVTKSGALVDTLRSEEQYVGNQKTGLFNVTFRPNDTGTYSFEAYFSYGVKETTRKTATIEVFSPSLTVISPQAIREWLFACTPRFVPLILLLIIIVLTSLLIKYINLWQWHQICTCPVPCPCHFDPKDPKKIKKQNGDNPNTVPQTILTTSLDNNTAAHAENSAKPETKIAAIPEKKWYKEPQDDSPKNETDPLERFIR